MSIAAANVQERTVQVWDLVVRVFHWTLAIAFFVAYFSGEGPLALHVWAGYLIGGLVVLRVVWGFVGTEYARFRDFLFGPLAAARYAAELVRFRAARYLGHSPAGAVMVFALLIGLLAVIGTGLELHAIENDAGPLADADSPAAILTVPALADEHEAYENEGHGGERGESFWEEAHEVVANLVLVLVLLHIGGVILASVAHHENLARAMVTGRKRAP